MLKKISIATFIIGISVFAIAQVPRRFQPMEISYFVTHTSPSGEVKTQRLTLKIDAEGRIDGTEDRLNADMDNKYRSVNFLETHPDFAKEYGTVAGFKTYVLRATLPDGTLREEHLSPEIGVIPLKSYTRYPDGTTAVRAAESVKIGQ